MVGGAGYCNFVLQKEKCVSKPVLSGVEGLFIPVSDPKVSCEWYQAKLGCQPLFQEENAAVLRLGNESGTVLCLVKVQTTLPIDFPENEFGVGKFVNFAVDDIEAAYETLLERGLSVGVIGREGNSRFFTFSDPDGNPLGICASG